MCIYVCIYRHIDIYINKFTYIYTCVCVCVCVYVCVRACVYVRVRVYTYIYVFGVTSNLCYLNEHSYEYTSGTANTRWVQTIEPTQIRLRPRALRILMVIQHNHHHRHHEHGNDSGFYRAVEPDSLIAILWHFSRFANWFFIRLII